MFDTPTLRGLAVTLRALEAGDAPALARATAERRDAYGFSPVPDGESGARAYVDKALRQRDTGFRMPFAVFWQDRIVGSTSYSELLPWEWYEHTPLQRTDRPDAVEIGYTFLAASAQRTRVNTEAKFLLLQYAFETWDVHSVTLRTDVRNERSRRAIERIGAKLDGVRRAHCPGRDGTVRSSAFYSIVRAEWPDVRARLEARLRAPA